MLKSEVFNRPYVRDITKTCECTCSVTCNHNVTELRPDRNPGIITKADRIRAMSDEELAVFICAVKFRRETVLEVPDFLYIKDAHDWIQKPAKEDT